MQVGLLWFDSDPQRGVTAKIEDAARRYREKFGQLPDTCYVNSATLNTAVPPLVSPQVSGRLLRVVPAANILPHHFWVGVEERREA